MSEAVVVMPGTVAPPHAVPQRRRRSAVAQWKLQLTAFATFITLLVLLVALGSAGAMWQVISQVARAERVDEVQARAAVNARLAVLEVDRLLSEILAEEDPARLRAAGVASIAAASRLEEAVTALRVALPANPRVIEMSSLIDGVKPQRVNVIVLARNGQRAEAAVVRQSIAEPLRKIDSVSASILQKQDESRRRAASDRAALFERLLYLLVATGALVTALGVVFYRRLMRRFEPVEQLLEEVAHSARELEDGGRQLDGINAGVQDTSRQMRVLLGTFQQATLAMTHEARACLQDVGRLSETCRASADMSRRHADEATQVAEQIHAVTHRLHRLLETTSALGRSRSEIASFADEIETISATTRLLSLNAAVEAARAGPAGRGFAVIAGSVRKLSEDTQQAALQIRRASEDITSQLAATTGAVQETSVLMDQGARRIAALDSSARSNQSLADGMHDEVQGFRGSFERQVDQMQSMEAESQALADALHDGGRQARLLDETSVNLARTSTALLQRLTNLQA